MRYFLLLSCLLFGSVWASEREIVPFDGKYAYKDSLNKVGHAVEFVAEKNWPIAEVVDLPPKRAVYVKEPEAIVYSFVPMPVVKCTTT